MATTKTLTPTNQAITIAAFTEKPDNRVNATNDDKLADAVNALNSKFTWTEYSNSGSNNSYPTDKEFLATLSSNSGGGFDSKLFPANPSGKNVYFRLGSSTVIEIYFNGSGSYTTTNIPSNTTMRIYTH